MSLVQDLKPLKRLDLICHNFANFIFRDIGTEVGTDNDDNDDYLESVAAGIKRNA